MTDLEKELQDVRQKQRETVEKLNQLRQQFQQQEQQLLQEILRLDGEARLLNRLSDNGKKAKGK